MPTGFRVIRFAPSGPPKRSISVRAAIAAMREPTEEMIDAWIRAPGAIKAGWQAMIDVALAGVGKRAHGPPLRQEMGLLGQGGGSVSPIVRPDLFDDLS